MNAALLFLCTMSSKQRWHTALGLALRLPFGIGNTGFCRPKGKPFGHVEPLEGRHLMCGTPVGFPGGGQQPPDPSIACFAAARLSYLSLDEAVTAGDFNNDGNLDIAGIQDYGVHVALNDGHGSMQMSGSAGGGFAMDAVAFPSATLIATAS